MTDPVISLITGTRNRKESYERFIASVREVAQVPYEILVADASNEPRYATNSGDVRTFLERPPMGYAAGYTRLLWHARGRLIVCLNDDCVMHNGWDVAAVKFMDETPECYQGCIYFKDYAYKGGLHFTLQSLLRCTYANYPVMRREQACDYGLFDDSYRFYAADTDLSFRIIADGHAVVGIPGCKLSHYREQDDIRMNNLSEAHFDGDLFKERWTHRSEELQEKMSRFPHLCNTRSIS
jgi:GT2 family glycosyltransferase